MSAPRSYRPSRGFPLGALFLLIALFAVLAALLGPLATADFTSLGDMIFASLAGGSSGAFFGSIIGLYHFQRKRGFLFGLATGFTVGMMCGPICILSLSHPWQIFFVSLAGATGLIGVALLYRCMNRDDPVSQSELNVKLLDQHQFKSLNVDLPSDSYQGDG